MFLYSGWRILNGALPYRDFWDHKPPLVYYVDAAGLALSNGTRWGVWVIEALLLLLTAWLGFKLLRARFGILCAALGSWIWLIALPPVLQAGNLTEEYALPFQFAALWLVGGIGEPRLAGRRGVILGILGALAFFLKQTTIGIWIAILLYQTVRQIGAGEVKEWLAGVVSVAAGAGIVCILIGAFFAWQGTLGQFWDAAFVFNVIYSSGDIGPVARLWQGVQGFSAVGAGGLWQLALFGLILGLISALRRSHDDRLGFAAFPIAMIDLPIELLLISLSGRANPHYYVSALPALSVLAAGALSAISSLITAWHMPRLATVTAALAVCLLGWLSYVVFTSQLALARRIPSEYPETARYIDLSTDASATVLVWGDEASVNYMARRASPTRFVYLFPLYEMGYGTKQLVADFLRSLVEDPPRLIVDTANPPTPFMDFRNLTSRSTGDMDWLHTHYVAAQSIGAWTIYQYAEDPVTP